MARKSKKEQGAAVVQSKRLVYIGPESILYDAQDRPVAYLEAGIANAELVLRMVESVNALAGYTLDEIRSGAFRTSVNANFNEGYTVVTGNGNKVMS